MIDTLSPSLVRVGTRASKLAVTQTRLVCALLQAAHPQLEIELVHITTKGDRILDRPLRAIGDKGLFVSELEQALRAEQIDIAVHSAKDLPSLLAEDMALPAFPARANPLDALIARDGRQLRDLPLGARVGTSSLRRACQLRALRPDLLINDLRGNVDTRLAKLRAGQYEAIILAAAGLERLGLADQISELLTPEVMVPAAAQGILALEARADRPAIAALLAPLDHKPTRIAALAERAFLARIGGGCQLPMGAYAALDGDTLTMIAMLGTDGGPLQRSHSSGPADEPEELGRALAEMLLV